MILRRSGDVENSASRDLGKRHPLLLIRLDPNPLSPIYTGRLLQGAILRTYDSLQVANPCIVPILSWILAPATDIEQPNKNHTFKRIQLCTYDALSYEYVIA